ncbi:MAG: putative Ig domain-containing protein [Planctomycetes bacterium]|nr:putative Ig domain-containing protein [Planctomycetota bacterium]
MTQREQNLALGLFGALAVWLIGWPMLRSIFVAPITDRSERLESLDEQLELKGEEEFLVVRTLKNYGRWKTASLPPDPYDAQRLYQEWLDDLAEIAGLREPKVTSGMTLPKGKVYTAVQVSVEAQCTLEELARFLHLFHRADLMHRIARVERIESQSNAGNPLLDVNLTAEALAIAAAPERRRIFAEAQLTEAAEDEAETLLIDNAAEFPEKPPFRVRVGTEYMMVTAADPPRPPLSKGGSSKADKGRSSEGPVRWTVERGVDGTAPEEHPENAVVEYAPVNPDTAARTPEFYASLLEENPFALPVRIEYRPQLAAMPEQTLIRGNELKFRLRATGFNPALGDLKFELGPGAPAGMTLDPADGELSWTPADDAEARRYEVPVIARQERSPGSAAEATLAVILREPNTPPEFPEIGPQNAWLGRPLEIPLAATDAETPPDRLQYRLGDGAPEGVQVSEGVLTWTPPLTVPAGPTQFTVIVSDDGEPPMEVSRTLNLDVRLDPASFTYLVGSVADGDVREAWLYDRSTNRRTVVRPGDTFAVADLTAYVLDVGLDYLMLASGDATWKLPLGKNLRSMQQQASRRTTAVEDATTEPISAPQPPKAGDGEVEAPVVAPRPPAAEPR